VQNTVEFIFSGMHPSRPAEAAARRRIRSLQHAHPAVSSWQVRVEAPASLPTGAEAYAVRLQVQGSSGTVVHAAASASELLAALRLAFNAIETELTAGREVAPRRGGWLQALRSRFVPSSFC
jgi:ribosome-associated translation inhibitor RaiA